MKPTLNILDLMMKSKMNKNRGSQAVKVGAIRPQIETYTRYSRVGDKKQKKNSLGFLIVVF